MIIRVCDDEAEQRENWVQSIRDALGEGASDQVARMDGPSDAISELLQRQGALRGKEQRADLPCEFDETDVLVVDYDLVHIDAKNARHTGEEFARLARLYSNVKYTIVMNQGNRSFDFDLSMTGRPQSYADLNLPARTISRPALWRGVQAGEFRPWQWNNIKQLITARSELVDALTPGDCLKTPIFDFVGIPASAVLNLSDQAYDFLDPSADTPAALQAVTFEEFLARTTEHRDIEELVAHNRGRAASVAVSRLGKWMSRMLLGPQEVLVDIPHLLQRCPFLMAPNLGSPSDISTWNAIIEAGLGALADEVKGCAFGDALKWIGRPAVWWSEVVSHPFFESARTAFNFSEVADAVFAEDTSRYIPFANATEFRAGFHNQFDNRYLERVGGVEYGPSRRLVFE